jgi:hypothetical protein
MSRLRQNSPSERKTRNALLENGRVYTGIVRSVDLKTLTMDVSVNEAGGTVFSNCFCIAPFVSRLVGINVHYMPEEGSRVVLVGANPPYVIGGKTDLPADDKMEGNGLTGHSETVDRKGRKAAKAGDRGAQSAKNIPYHADMVPGELSMTNLLRVGVNFLTTMVQVKAGDMAVIEACLFNNMVRILSRTYKHFSAFGRHEIYADGNTLNVMWQGSHLAQDQWEKSENTTARGQAGDGAGVKVDPAKLREEGRARFGAFVGHVGDFLNLFVQDPCKVLGDVAAPYPTGRFRAHVGTTGDFLMQTTGEIVLERVCRIPVPVRKKDWDDPKGTPAKTLDNLNNQATRVWDSTSNEGGNPFHACFQLREQSRWISSYHSLARVWAMSAADVGDGKTPDWYLPTENEVAAPLPGADDPFMKDTDTLDFVETFATIRILRDGSILTMSGDGSCILQGNGDLHLSCPKNFFIEAGGSFVGTFGQDFLVRARRSVEVSSDSGPALVRGAAGLRLFADKGPVHLRGVASAATDAIGQDEGDPAPDVLKAGQGSKERKYGVVIASEQGGVRVEGSSNVDIDAKDSAVNLTAKSVSIRADFDVILHAGRHFLIQARRNLHASCMAFLTDVSSGLIRLGSNVTIRGSDMHVPMVKANTVNASNVSTAAGGPTGKFPTGDARKQYLYYPWGTSNPAQPEINMDGWNKPDAAGAPTDDGSLVSSIAKVRSYRAPDVPALWTVSNPQFISQSYLPDAALFQTLTQQHVGIMLESASFGTWNMNSSGNLAFAKVGTNSVPFPGKAAQRWTMPSGAGQRLDKPATSAPPGPDDSGWKGKVLTPSAFSGQRFIKNSLLDSTAATLKKD